MSKAKRAARTLERRRKRDKAKPGGSPRAEVAPPAPGSEPSGDRPAAASDDALPWYARPPRRHLWALISVSSLLAVWLGYLSWVAMYHGRGSGQ